MVVQKNFHKLFKPLKKLGKGSSATVIEGIDLRDGKSYAVKGFKKSMGFSI
jgi:serine/threonine protein kinase